jgi:hypothetical protein
MISCRLYSAVVPAASWLRVEFRFTGAHLAGCYYGMEASLCVKWDSGHGAIAIATLDDEYCITVEQVSKTTT